MRNELLEMLNKRIKARLYARDCMAKRARHIGPDVTIKDARRIFKRSAAGALLVMKKRRLVGILTKEGVKKALLHGMGHRAICQPGYFP